MTQIQDHLANDHPCIAFVNTAELPYWTEATGHAVVVVGIDDDNLYLNDPAFHDAPKKVSQGDFLLAWLEADEYYALIQRKS